MKSGVYHTDNGTLVVFGWVKDVVQVLQEELNFTQVSKWSNEV